MYDFKGVYFERFHNLLKALTNGIYTINKLPHQLPYSLDVHVYGFTGGRPGTAYAPCALHNMPLLVWLAKYGHAAKTLVACERHYDFITFLGIPRKLDFVWRLASNF